MRYLRSLSALMPMTRKQFLTRTAAAAAASMPAIAAFGDDSLGQLRRAIGRMAGTAPSDAALDEALWERVRGMYAIDPEVINLNSGGVSPQPLPVQDDHVEKYRYSNTAPTYRMWHRLDAQREELRSELATLAGCDAEEAAINRNATEALNTVIFGLRLERGDEVVLSTFDYPNMLNAWKQRAMRDGIVLRFVRLPLPLDDEDEIVRLYAEAITPRTKAVHVTYMVNWNGQTVPVKRITRMAQERGCRVIVDGAHAFAHIPHSFRDIGCDYYGTSLHKWLGAPFGSGMLAVRKDRIAELWPLLSNQEPESTDIRKFETLGTRSFASEMAIRRAIGFHNELGAERKTARLWHLRQLWADAVKGNPKVRMHTPLGEGWGCAMATVGIAGMTAQEIDGHLWEMHRIHTSPVSWEGMEGVRISPNVFTSPRELQVLADALLAIADRR